MNFQKFGVKAGGERAGGGKGKRGGGAESREGERKAWQQGIGQCKLLSVVWNGASAC